jgi:hypothetical protein
MLVAVCGCRPRQVKDEFALLVRDFMLKLSLLCCFFIERTVGRRQHCVLSGRLHTGFVGSSGTRGFVTT